MVQRSKEAGTDCVVSPSNIAVGAVISCDRYRGSFDTGHTGIHDSISKRTAVLRNCAGWGARLYIVCLVHCIDIVLAGFVHFAADFEKKICRKDPSELGYMCRTDLSDLVRVARLLGCNSEPSANYSSHRGRLCFFAFASGQRSLFWLGPYFRA